MDRKIVLLALAVIASGCTATDTTGSNGLKVEELSVSDRSLSPGQRGVVTLRLKNYHSTPVEVEPVSLYNTGPLNVKKLGCSPEELAEPRKGYNPGMECTWEVEIPEKSSGIRDKTVPVKLNLAYTTELSNAGKPIKIHVMPLKEIQRTARVRKTFTNGEVKMTVETESPVPFQGRNLEVNLENVGKGRVDSNYTLSYFPESLMKPCPDQVRPLEGEAKFGCVINPEGDRSSTRNLILSTSYKYVKAPTLNIRVVNDR